MPVALPALPALMAGQALRTDAMAAAQAALEQVRQLVSAYDLTLSLVRDLPPPARDALTAALSDRATVLDRLARHCKARLDEATDFVRSLDAALSPTDLVEVPGPFFEMLSPYLDDAMDPVLGAISRRATCSPEEVAAIFPRPRPTLAA
jgi:hypothetical protein